MNTTNDLGMGGRSTQHADYDRARNEEYLEDPAAFLAYNAAAPQDDREEMTMTADEIEDERMSLWNLVGR